MKKFKVMAKMVTKNGKVLYSLYGIDWTNRLCSNCYFLSSGNSIPDINIGDIVVGSLWYDDKGLDRFIYDNIERSK